MKYLFVTFFIIFVAACSDSGGVPTIASLATPQANTATGAPPSSSISAQRLTYKIGPFNLPAGTKAINMQDSPGAINFQTEEPLWVTAFQAGIEGANGEELPTTLLHSAIVTNSAERNPLCTERQAANPFMAVTGSTKSIELPERHGYPVNSEDPLEARVILQNPTNQDFNNVYFTFKLTAIQARSERGFVDVAPILLEADPCDHTPLSVAPRTFSQRDAEFSAPENGLLTKAYGLLQDYGVEVSLKAKDQPTPLWTALAEVAPNHSIISLPVYEDPAGIPIRSGDKISINVSYDNTSDQWQPSATGAVMAYIARTNPPPTTTVSATTAQRSLLNSN